MHQRGAPRSSGQRRPRLLRATATEPSIFTLPTVNHTFDMAQTTSFSGGGSCSSPGSSGSGSYRRATDLLNHVAFLSSCATSPVSSLNSSPVFDRMTPRRSSPNAVEHSSSATAVGGAGRSHSIGRHGSGGSGGGISGRSSSRSADASADACRRRDTDEVFGSSPASTHTSGSLEDLHAHHPCSANYYSFPSFDMYDPDNQDKEDDIDG